LKREVNKREFLKRDPEAQNIVNTLDDRPDEFKTTPPNEVVNYFLPTGMPVNSAILLVDRHYAFYFLSQLVYSRGGRYTVP
jgi:hypothetical protein